jgi:hypothetical protein
MRRTCHKPAHANPFRAQGSGLSEGETISLGWRAVQLAHAHARTAVCAKWFDPSRGCVHAHTRTCRYEQADIGTAAEYLRSRPDTGSSCLWGAWLAGPCSHGTQILGVGDGGAGVMAIVSVICIHGAVDVQRPHRRGRAAAHRRGKAHAPSLSTGRSEYSRRRHSGPGHWHRGAVAVTRRCQWPRVALPWP